MLRCEGFTIFGLNASLSVDVTAVIMAGGKNSRCGVLGQIPPKCLFPVIGNQTLLTRLLDQLRLGGIRRAVVCCSPESFSLIGPFVTAYRSATSLSEVEVTAICCLDSRLGPVPALAEALSSVAASWYLVCLADIFFAHAPFASSLRALNEYAAINAWIVTGTDERSQDSSGTGFVECDGSVVRAVSNQPFRGEQLAGRQIRRWSGSFFFREEMLADLRHRSQQYRDTPLESWVQGLLDRQASCGHIDGGHFVNVNSMQDYQYLVCRNRGGSED